MTTTDRAAAIRAMMPNVDALSRIAIFAIVAFVWGRLRPLTRCGICGRIGVACLQYESSGASKRQEGTCWLLTFEQRVGARQALGMLLAVKVQRLAPVNWTELQAVDLQSMTWP